MSSVRQAGGQHPPYANVLTVAGSDSSGGAGIQADIKTITAHGMYAMSAITALTAQNTMGVYAVQEATGELVARQIDAVCSDIRPDATKVGMVSSAAIIEAIADRLAYWQLENIVIDPVMVATSGAMLLDPDAQEALVELLLPLACVITPNRHEAEALLGERVEPANKAAMEAAARAIAGLTTGAVLLKGGHFLSEGCEGKEANDLLYYNNSMKWFSAPWVDTANTHGTGCTLSAAIACGLAAGKTLEAAILDAKRYVTAALASGLDLGSGSGPLNHFAAAAY